MDRYSRNLTALSEDENLRLRKSRVCVVGCGGLGGHIIEMLGRLGIGSLTVVDGDVFDETNLNRQILCSVTNLGTSKVLAAAKRMSEVNPDVRVSIRETFISPQNARSILSGHHLIIDALDNIENRLLLEQESGELGIPLVHGAVAGWYGQLSTVFPGDETLKRIYRNPKQKGSEQRTGNLSFGTAFVAALQAAEAIKVLLGRGELLRGKLLVVDLLQYDFEILSFRQLGDP